MANFDPLSFTTLIDGSGVVAASAKINYYETGSTTPKAVYSDAGLTSAITQPVRASSLGVMPVVYLKAGRYKRAVTTSADVTLSAYAADPIDASVEMITAASAPSPTFPFLRYYDTGTGHVYERNSTDTGWTDLGAVDSLLNAATVTQQLAGTATTVASTPDSVASLWQRGTDIASAGTLSLPSSGGNVFNITGTTGVTGISSAQGGRAVWLKFAGALTITHNGTSMILPGAANITTVAGDTAIFVNEAAQDASGSNWRCWAYNPASFVPFAIATQAQMETGTSNVVVPPVGRLQNHPGMAKCWLNSDFAGGTTASYNITSIVDTAAGRVTVTIATDFSSINWCPVPSTGSAAAFSGTFTAIAAGTVELKSWDSAGTNTDATAMTFVGYGDQ